MEVEDLDVELENFFLQHFGIKGMRWGVRKAKESLSTASDAKEARALITRAKVGGVTNLSNKEISAAINRMALEKQYKQLHGDTSLKQRGAKFVGKLLLNFGKDYISSFIKHPGANAATGGNFAWAYAGAKTIDGIVINRSRELGA